MNLDFPLKGRGGFFHPLNPDSLTINITGLKLITGATDSREVTLSSSKNIWGAFCTIAHAEFFIGGVFTRRAWGQLAFAVRLTAMT